jgi:hypothetical protein
VWLQFCIKNKTRTLKEEIGCFWSEIGNDPSADIDAVTSWTFNSYLTDREANLFMQELKINKKVKSQGQLLSFEDEPWMLDSAVSTNTHRPSDREIIELVNDN